MVRVLEKRIHPPIPESEYTAVVKRACDLCGREAAKGYEGVKGSYWFGEPGQNLPSRIEIRLTIPLASTWPTVSTLYEIDLCPDCFKEKLIPWMESQGVNVEPTEDYYS